MDENERGGDREREKREEEGGRREYN